MAVVGSSPAQYLVDLEVTIKALGKKGGELTKYLKAKKKMRLKEQVLIYQEDPGAKAKLMDLYQKAKGRQFERHQEHQRKKLESMDDEKAITTARLFLARYTAGGTSEEAAIPGFPGHGQEAAQRMLQDLAQVPAAECESPPVDE